MIFEGPYYSPRTSWDRIIGEALQGYFEENKDMIIDLTASKLADSYRRTKAFKEKMASAIEEK